MSESESLTCAQRKSRHRSSSSRERESEIGLLKAMYLLKITVSTFARCEGNSTESANDFVIRLLRIKRMERTNQSSIALPPQPRRIGQLFGENQQLFCFSMCERAELEKF